MKKQKDTEKKISLQKLQIVKLTNMNIIRGGDEFVDPQKTVRDKTQKTILTTTF